ncbi:MAG: hypothetical protein PHO00_03080 [bacterium]|nr:hypothetical protein [bacterium]
MKKSANYEVSDSEFIINDYNNTKPFSSFFPSIAGVWGKPMWIFYVNRGQAIACMGTTDKNGAITEFVAANKAYRQTPSHGFRTFIKTGGRLHEPFKQKTGLKKPVQRMHITSDKVKLSETDASSGFETTVEYFGVPNEEIPAFVRILKIKNISRVAKNIDCIDGMPVIEPYGTGDYLLKNMSRLAEGWFSGVEFSGKYGAPAYKLKVVPEDNPEIEEIKAANFYGGFVCPSSGRSFVPSFITDPEDVFGEFKDFSEPEKFMRPGLFRFSHRAEARNKTPSAFGYFSCALKPGAEISYYSVIGKVSEVREIDSFLRRAAGRKYFDSKKKESAELVNSITDKILTKSSSPEFDNYCRQTFLDNLLRGGLPVTLGSGPKKMNYYVYSRIHGDMEREYNNFVIMPEFFSQGTGNYRDVNQNRRNDVFFNPRVKEEVISCFVNLLQSDGFNPLKIEGSKFMIRDRKGFLSMFKGKARDAVGEFISYPFSLGGFFNMLERNRVVSGIKEKALDKIVSCGERIDCASPAVGYWSDHWHYNTDLIEAFLAVYPEKEKELFFGKKDFVYYDNPLVVRPRAQKYVLFNSKPRQLNAVAEDARKKEMIERRKDGKYAMRKQFGRGGIYRTTLAEKLLCLAANKFASLDPAGIGVEMESDKPNWCDALNGLPGLFGSSIAETIELKRLLILILRALEKAPAGGIILSEEVEDLLSALGRVSGKNGADSFKAWDERHNVLENYRKNTLTGFSGRQNRKDVKELEKTLRIFLAAVDKGIKKAVDAKTGMVKTNFESVVEKYEILKERGRPKTNSNGLTHIRALKFRHRALPDFLEGPVHYLRVCDNRKKAEAFHRAVMKSGIYDKKLGMLKVNAPLAGEGIDIGRINIFTRGWLENESIWLHMEYKYLLELLRSGLTGEFYKISGKALVPFMEPAVYGRSIFENSSFIASSAHPDKKIHGQGFVSRLSGSTAEFLSIWIFMTSGIRPFRFSEGKLSLKFEPALSSDMFTKEEGRISVYLSGGPAREVKIPKNSFAFKFLSDTLVVYHNAAGKRTFGPGKAEIASHILEYCNGRKTELSSAELNEPYASDVRDGKVKKIDIILA